MHNDCKYYQKKTPPAKDGFVIRLRFVRHTLQAEKNEWLELQNRDENDYLVESLN